MQCTAPGRRAGGIFSSCRRIHEEWVCNTPLADLQGTGLRCPGFAEYAPRLLSFMKDHPEVGSAAMV